MTPTVRDVLENAENFGMVIHAVVIVINDRVKSEYSGGGEVDKLIKGFYFDSSLPVKAHHFVGRTAMLFVLEPFPASAVNDAMAARKRKWREYRVDSNGKVVWSDRSGGIHEAKSVLELEAQLSGKQ